MYGFIGTSVNVVFSVFILFLSFSDETCAQPTVFQSHDIFSKPAVCLHCANNTPSVITKSASVHKEQKILVFIDPQCPWCHKALLSLNDFKKKNPHWAVQIYIMATIKEFVDFVHTEIPSLPLDLDYTLDVNGSLADKYGVHKTPTYIISNHDNQKKVEGYVDLGRLDFNGGI